MNRKNPSVAIGMACFATLLWTASASSQTEHVLYNFGGSVALAGANPVAGLVFDTSGNLYGTTENGGLYRTGDCYEGCGTVFQLAPNGSGGWKANFLYSFRGIAGNDGANPSSPIIFDGQGNLYGTSNCPTDCASYYGGYVFRLTPTSDGTWTESNLYAFAQAGCVPGGTACSVAFDPAGHLYGSELFGFTDCSSISGRGEVIALDELSFLNWYRVIVHCFNTNGDGASPQGVLTFDTHGNIYGTTNGGGSGAVGIVYKLTPNHQRPGWSETVLYTFQGGSDGAYPAAGVVLDNAGNVYGTTSQGGSAGVGTVFELTPQSDQAWSETVLYSFQGGNDAANPNSSLSFDSSGALYGTAGGGASGQGTVFKLTPSSGGPWTESVVYAFSGGLDGGLPSGGVTFDSSGNLYGTASVGGSFGQNGGVAFEIMP